MPKLKPCPFCGHAPTTFPKDPEHEGNAWGEVACVNDKCHVQPSCLDGVECADSRGSAAYIAAAARCWNRRAAA